MKSINLFIPAISLAFAALLSSSCQKEQIPAYKYDVTFYVGGYNDGASCIYKDSEILYDFGADSYVSGIALMSDGSLYACGETFSKDKGKTMTAAVWKDGKPLDLDFVKDKDCYFESIAANGDKWACCGTYLDETDRSFRGFLVENGEVVYTSENDVYFYRVDYGASGDLFVVADDKEVVKLLRITSEAPYRLLSSEQVAVHEKGFSWIVECIHAGSRDVAVGMNKYYSDSQITDAYVWLNGGRGLQFIDKNSEINDITFFCGNLVVAGDSYTVAYDEDDDPIFETTAVQWVDGHYQDFSYGCIGNSSTTMVKNWNDTFIFQCVQSEGGIQLCHNGSLYKEIKAPAGFCATCWDVDVKLVQD
ncbi:MAG: hypothetical protein Q4F39_00955 [Bacteroidia bacterium]|nr:hypothetical protein [Bacteroidia bacterium]